MDEAMETLPADPAEDGTVATWDHRIPLLTNRFMLWDLLRASVASVALMWLSVFVMGLAVDGEPVMLPPGIVAIVTGVFLGLLLLSCLLLGNHVDAWFGVGPAGVVWASGRRERAINRAATFAGLLAGSAGTTGAGLLATANESGVLPWREVHRVIEHPGQRVLTVRNSWRTVVRLYVPAEDWERVRALVAEGVAQGAAERVASPGPKRLWFPIAAWIAGPLVLVVLALAWEFRPDETGLWALLAGIFVCLAGETIGAPRRIFAAFALAPCAFALILTGSEALSPYASIFGGMKPTWTLDTPVLALSLGAQGLLGLLALGMLVLPQRRRD